MSKLAQVIVNGLFSGSVYSLVAVGYALIYGVLRLVNFAHGGVVTMGAFAALIAAWFWGANLVPMAIVTIIVGALAGWALERLAYRPIRSRPPLTALITALGIATIIENTLAAVFGSDSRSLPLAAGFETAVFSWGPRFTGVQLFTFLSALGLLWATWSLVQHSRFGQHMRAIADDPSLAILSGVDVDRITSRTFMLSSALGAIAGLIFALDVGCDPFMGTLIGFKAFVSCVVGGSNFAGAVVGGLLMGLFESGVGAYISSNFRDAIVMSVLVLMLLARPDGLFRFIRGRIV